jgi:hypothetical protein
VLLGNVQGKKRKAKFGLTGVLFNTKHGTLGWIVALIAGSVEMADVILKIAILLYDLVLLGGTAYLVQEHNWSMWTFLLAALFFMTSRKEKCDKKETTV